MAKTVYINARFLTQQITGVQQFAFEICRYLQQGDVEFILLTPMNCEFPKALSHLTHQVVGKNTGYIWEQIELPSFLKKQGSPLLLNFCNTAPLLYKNQWITIHDLAFMHHPEWFSKNFARVYRFLIPRIARKSAKVFTVSKTIAAQIESTLKIPTAKISVLYNGLSQDLLAAKAIANPRKKMILTVSSINPRKNLGTLIKAFNLANIPNYDLVIVGAKNMVFANTAYPNEVSPHVSFVGYINNTELIRLYQQASLFVSLSLDEGFGIPVLEALHLGCPVLLSDIGVYKECFSDIALFTSPHNAEQAGIDMRNAIEHPPIVSSINNLLQQYNYANSSKELMKLVKEFHEKM